MGAENLPWAQELARVDRGQHLRRKTLLRFEVAGPRIGPERAQPGGHGRERERPRRELRLELVPRERGRDRRTRTRAGRERRDRGARADVAEVVDEDLVLAAFFGHRRAVALRALADELASERARKGDA